MRASMFCFFVKAHGEENIENGAIVANCGEFVSVSVGPKNAKCKDGKEGKEGKKGQREE